jgi:radical SAM superfamily enzyme YgiQ (UPF0313 family)
MSKVLLCIPPDYDRYFPPLGTPALCGFLKNRGIDAAQIDLNIAYRDFLFRRLTGPSISGDEKKLVLKESLKAFFSEKLQGRYYSPFLVRKEGDIFPYLPYDNNANSSFYFTERLLSSEVLERYLEDEAENTFLQSYLEADFLSRIEKENPLLIGISIISPSQAIASLTLGKLIKKRFPKLYVNLGGQWVTLYRQALAARKDLWECFDSLIVFEGETPLAELAAALEAKRDISGIANVIPKNSIFDKLSFKPRGEDLDQLPCPDFSGLPLDAYDESSTGKRSLTFEMSRGCYWAKCAYCVDLPLPKPSYRAKSAHLIVRDLKELKKKYQAHMLLLGDPGLSPKQMLEVSRAILREKIDINWWCMTRLDHGFSRDIFKTAAQAGLKKINFGFESASDKVCDFLDKGNSRLRSERVIRDCAASGIEVDLQTMIGLPGESFQDGLQTIDFLVQNKEFISAVTFNIYYLTPSNHIYLKSEHYGLKVDKSRVLPFQFFIPFQNEFGMSRDEAHLLQKIYYTLRAKGDRGQEFLAGDAAGIPGAKADQWADLSLCGETARVHFDQFQAV